MFFKIVKILCKLFGITYLVELAKKKLSISICQFQYNIKAQAKKIGAILLFVFLIFMLFSSGFHFLLLGLAYWLNSLLCSAYMGFFIISIFCFLMVMLIFVILYRKMHYQEEK
ncbi:hypothetical protein EDM02_03715 [Candidatus Cardinium hertigii]|jgi:protein-S-isoprenylcysteine O-methyltransferase Ste14|uniref:Phage holin family protein n=1 Tax=Candidatus Cardinium hertigii TaxID=247481 RepID=A0A3N2QBP9_9BACT|nr:hypothetical protein EDM02_03715 [Candidatus Cardinium hertigii]